MTSSRTDHEEASMNRQHDVEERSRRPAGEDTRERLLAEMT